MIQDEHEDALQNAAEGWQRTFDAIPDMIMLVDSQHRITRVNQATARVLGLSCQEIVGQPCFLLIHGTDAPPGFCPHTQTMADGKEHTAEIHEANLGRDFLVTTTPLFDDSGTLTGSVHVMRDITERKKAGEALRLSELRFRSLVEQTTDAVFCYEYDPPIPTDLPVEEQVALFYQGVLVECNDVCARSYGAMRAEEVIGGKLAKLFGTSPGSLDNFFRAFIQNGYRVVDLEGTEVLDDGTERYYLNNGHGVVEDGMLVRVWGAFRDITERKRAEEALRESEKRYRTLFEKSPASITLLDNSGVIIDCNKSTEKLIGYSKEEIIEKPFEKLLTLDPKDVPHLEEKYTELSKGLEVEPYELEIIRKDGIRRWIRVINSLLMQDDAIVGFQIIARDITERKRAEQLLRTLNEAALAMERALTPEEIFTAVAEEFKKLGFFCIVFPTDESQSRLFPKYLSYEAGVLKAAEKLVGLKAEDFSFPVEAVDVYREVVREKKTVFVKNAEELLRQLLPKPVKRFAGQIVRMLKVPRAITAPLIVEDKVIGVLSVQSGDLTEDDVPAITAFAHQMAAAWRKANLMQDLEGSLEELKRTQAQLLRSQKLEAVGRLASGVAHDFNNLLTAITGYSELLLHSLDDHDPLREDVEQIKKAGQRAASLTCQLLAFSRRQALQPQVLDLNATVANLGKMLRRLIGEDIELITVLEPGLGRVQADPGQIEQVIMNLAVNARDAMPQGGKLTITTENVTLYKEDRQLIPKARPGQFVRLSVEDMGVGMDKEAIQHIFEPFFSTKENGTGLGLAVVYGIVRQHEGWIAVYSEPGQGSTFKVYLPAFSLKLEDETEETISLQELRGRGERILVVEDAKGVRELVRRVLGENGYVVFEAASAEEALDIFEREKEDFHLVFSDVVLPDRDGLQLVDQLLVHKPELRVLLSSGYTDRKSQWPVIRERGLRFLQKPYAAADLLRAIREAIESDQGGKG